MPKESPKINNLSFDDDMIIICKTEVRTMQLISRNFEKYKEASGQKLKRKVLFIYIIVYLDKVLW